MTHTKKELQAIYFGFYDQLPEPLRSEAKERWDYGYAKYHKSKSIAHSIFTGWDWSELNEYDKWNKIYDQLEKDEIQLTPSEPTLSDIKKQLDRIEELLNTLIEK